MTNLKRRRERARAKKNALKVFNLHRVSQNLDSVLVELNTQAGRDPEIDAAIEVIEAAKDLLAAYSQRVLNTPFKSRYDGFFERGSGFESGRENWDRRRQERKEREREDLEEETERRIERRIGEISRETREKLSKIAESRPRDSQGRFI